MASRSSEIGETKKIKNDFELSKVMENINCEKYLKDYIERQLDDSILTGDLEALAIDKSSSEKSSAIKLATQNVGHETWELMTSEKYKAKEEQDNICRKAYHQKMSGFVETRTDDGDQSPLNNAQFSQISWMEINGLDWQPCSPIASDWLNILASGNFDAMLDYIKNKTDEQVHDLLEVRETALNYSALFHVIRGVKVLGFKHKPRHVECLAKLLELGANVHARDFRGGTPLHLSCSSKENDPTMLKIMKILLKSGADVNAKNRRGDTALFIPVINMRVDFVKILLEAGADPTILNVNGNSVETLLEAQHNTMKPLFVEARKKRARQMREKGREEVGGSLKRCGVCGETNDTSRCTGCFLTCYCGPECQKIDWKKHKDACREIQSQYEPVKLTRADNLVVIHGGTSTVKVIGKDKKQAKENFIVKIQIPFSKAGKEKASLLLHDKKMTVIGEIEKSEPSYSSLFDIIRSGGVFGDKGFFYAIFDEKKTLKINTAKILPPEVW